MESVGAFPDAEWDSISRMLNGDQGFDHAPHLLGQYPFSHECYDNSVISSTFCPSLEASMGGVTESLFCSFDGLSSGLQYIFQESSIGSGECYYFNDCGDVMSTDIYMAGEKSSSFAAAFPDTSMDEPARVDDSLGNPFDGQLPAMAVPDREWQLKRKFVDSEGNAILSKTPKKKARASRAEQEIPKSKKTRKVVTNGKDEEESNAVKDPQSSSSCSSEGNIASEEPETPSTPMTVSGKTRASRGSATNPQSLYARKRREKINERLRTLQTLVPNGTKVDISTMLEEAVQYVKFLQLQIKLLSSDDTWMYAPIAYNGMDLGLSSRMSPTSL